MIFLRLFVEGKRECIDLPGRATQVVAMFWLSLMLQSTETSQYEEDTFSYCPILKKARVQILSSFSCTRSYGAMHIEY